MLFRSDIFRAYVRSQTQIAQVLKSHAARVAFLTPQPVEDKRPDPDKDVRNESLRRFSDGLKEVAVKENSAFVDQFDQIGAVLVEAAGEAQDANAPRARELAHAAGIGRLTRDELEARTRTLCQDVEEGLELGVVRHSARDELTGAVSVEEVGRQPE